MGTYLDLITDAIIKGSTLEEAEAIAEKKMKEVQNA